MTLKIRKDNAWVDVNPSKIGSITVTANGDISAGDPVILNSDGTVSKVQNSNLTANNFLGFSQFTYANNDTAIINIVSSIDTNQSGLTAGQKYYVQGNGTLSTTPATPKVEAGVALSATNLLISGSQMVGGSSKPSLNRPFATKGWWIPFT